MLHSNAEKFVREHMKIMFCSLLLAKLFSSHAALKCPVLCLPVHIALSGKRFLWVGSDLVSSQAVRVVFTVYYLWAKALPHCQTSQKTEN